MYGGKTKMRIFMFITGALALFKLFLILSSIHAQAYLFCQNPAPGSSFDPWIKAGVSVQEYHIHKDLFRVFETTWRAFTTLLEFHPVKFKLSHTPVAGSVLNDKSEIFLTNYPIRVYGKWQMNEEKNTMDITLNRYHFEDIAYIASEPHLARKLSHVLLHEIIHGFYVGHIDWNGKSHIMNQHPKVNSFPIIVDGILLNYIRCIFNRPIRRDYHKLDNGLPYLKVKR